MAALDVERFLSHQENLPSLPVPPLQQTLDKFVSSSTPLFSDEELSQVKEMVAQFGQPGGEGEQLQRLLLDKAKGTVNWLSDWWLNLAYLEYRLPCPIHVNPGIVTPVQNFKGQEDQLRHTAKLISGILEYKIMVDHQTLPIDKLGGNELCMKQFYNILGCCRVPGEHRDRVLNFPGDVYSSPKHVTVIHNNNIFEVPVYGDGGHALNVDQIYGQLKAVCEGSNSQGPPLGILTTQERGQWFNAYDTLVKDPENAQHLESIQRSIVVVCLDKAMPSNAGRDEQTIAANQMNHGGGSTVNSANRWFDKILQMIVGPDGHVGFNYEHSTAEGPPIIALADYILKKAEKEFPVQEPATGVEKPTHLNFNIVPSVTSAMQTAASAFDELISDLDLISMEFDSYGKNFPKSQKLSPDAFIQVAFQLAFYQIHGHSTATYESGSLRKFRHGRTDTIRSCSIASHAFCQSMRADSGCSGAEKAQRLRAAVQAHRAYTDQVVNGQGIDRHLLGLKLIALENGVEVPQLLNHPLYQRSCNWQISTSQVASSTKGVLGFAPVIPDGYGLCYNPMEDRFRISISTWRSSPMTDSIKFEQSLKRAFEDSKRVLIESGSAKL
ncbi:hypothetical protein CAPTEDRAFT_218819 [Capitella teleta]|uniref:Choline/carnitine acyltransferase domain-containing protein n=1 Tax=Capitella teleta TaxID=283909 RepID=R7THX7_CAPTE|nr:hypothetical protein CAPTEDRAFT_218819 [Capitella teleta]|eukprot:ELT93087.1 hypothetical protein CAPTEDRAFT_218819 [Capitella teleta]